MKPFRHEVQEFIRVTNLIFSLEAFDTQLSEEERGVILLCTEDLTKRLSRPNTVKPDYGHAREKRTAEDPNLSIKLPTERAGEPTYGHIYHKPAPLEHIKGGVYCTARFGCRAQPHAWSPRAHPLSLASLR